MLPALLSTRRRVRSEALTWTHPAGRSRPGLRLQGGARTLRTLDWRTWHADYDDPNSALGRRLVVVRRLIAQAIDLAPEGPVTVISVCAGQGHDLIGALVAHPRKGDVRAHLVELDEDNARAACQAAARAGLDHVDVVVADASTTDVYAGAVPADVIVLCGVFGNITGAGIKRTIACLPMLAASGATVVWTRHRHPPDASPAIRAAFERAGFAEVCFETPAPFGVGLHRLEAQPRSFEPGVRMFDFVGYDVLRSELLPSQKRAGT